MRWTKTRFLITLKAISNGADCPKTVRRRNLIDITAPYPSGKGEVCKTFMHQFESGRRLIFGPWEGAVFFQAGLNAVRSPENKVSSIQEKYG